MRFVKSAVSAAAILAPLAGIASLVLAWHAVRIWLTYHTGAQNTSGAPPNYNFWSGFGSDLGEFAIAGGVVTIVAGLWHKFNCHTAGCYRIGIHHIAGGVYVVCRKHHNAIAGHDQKKLSLDFLKRRHAEHLAVQANRAAGSPARTVLQV